MSEADWGDMSAVLDNNTLKRAVTSGITVPNGGGTFARGVRSLASTEGAYGQYVNLANFNPTAALKGGRITGALCRRTSSGSTDYAQFFAIGINGSNPPSVNDNAYLFGFSNDSPSHLVLRKGKISEGIPAGNVGSAGILRKSSSSFALDVWLHLRIDWVVSGNSDVNLQMFASDLGAHAVTAPSWAAIAGMGDYLDDALGANSGSLPYTAGFFGYAHWSKGINRISAFDHIVVERQL